MSFASEDLLGPTEKGQAKDPVPAFEIHFEGENIYPEEVPMRTLSGAISAVQKLVTGGGGASSEVETSEDEDESSEDDKGALSLLQIRRGSAVYIMGGPSSALARRNLLQVGRVLERPDEVDAELDYVLNPIERLSAIARRLGCTITFREPLRNDQVGAVWARIEPASYEELSKSILVQGETSFWGKVMRVGGATGLRCGLRVDFQQRMLICKVEDSRVARQIGQRLYQDVEVFGKARWFRNSWRIFTFTIHEVKEQPVQGSLVDALEELREAGGNAWDLIDDPRAYLEDIETDD